MKKILIISPKFPLPTTGACEQDRLAGFLQLKRLGYDVRVISKIFNWQDRGAILEWGQEHTIPIDLIPYESRKSFSQKMIQLLNPVNWDGAAYEYKLPDTQRVAKEVLEEYKPDVVWFDYSYLWPLYRIFQERNIPIITRSINFEPMHFLNEDGMGLVNILKFFPKLFSEMKVIKNSDCFFALSSYEGNLYEKLGAKNVHILPLRNMPNIVKTDKVIRDAEQLHLFFMGASYNAPHNRRAAALIIKEIAPELEKRAPGKFFFHILGKKLPADLSALCSGNIKEEGFVPDLDTFLGQEVDIAVVPGLNREGMHQKIFEPLARGIPTIASPRGLGGYPFKGGEHLLLAEIASEFVAQILKLQDIDLRRQLSNNALRLSQKLFSEAKLDGIAMKGLNSVVSG